MWVAPQSTPHNFSVMNRFAKPWECAQAPKKTFAVGQFQGSKNLNTRQTHAS